MNNCIPTDTLNEMDKFLGRLKLPKLTQEEIDTLNQPVTSKDIQLAIIKKKLPQKKSSSSDSFNIEFYQTFVRRKHFSTHSETSITLIPKPEKTSQENYKPVSLMNMDTKFLYKIVGNQIQQHIKKKDYMTN